MLKEIDLDLSLKTEDNIHGGPVGVVENVANDLGINELAYEIEIDTHKISYTTETISAIENSIVASIESGKMVVTDIVKVLADTINNINNENLIDIYEEGIVISKENSVYVEGLMDKIKKTAKAVWNKIKSIVKKIIEFFKKIINKILGKSSEGSGDSGGGEGSVKSIINKLEKEDLSYFAKAIKEGNKEEIEDYLNKDYKSYKELFLRLTEHTDKIEFNIESSGNKVTVKSVIIKNYRALTELEIKDISGVAVSDFNELKSSITYFNKHREVRLFSLGGDKLNISYEAITTALSDYGKVLKGITSNVTIGRLINLEGTIGEVDISKVTLIDYGRAIGYLTSGLKECIEAVKEEKSKGITARDGANEKTNTLLSNEIWVCVDGKIDNTKLKGAELTGKLDKDLNVKTTEPITMFAIPTVDIDSIKKELQERRYESKEYIPRLSVIPLIGLVIDKTTINKIDNDNLADSIELDINLEIDLSKNIEDEFSNMLFAIAGNEVISAITKLNDNFRKIVNELMSMAEKLDADMEEIEKNAEEFLSKVVNTFNSVIIKPLKDLVLGTDKVTNLFIDEHKLLSEFITRYIYILYNIFSISIVKKALEVTSESE